MLFKDFLGQNKIINYLKKAISENNISHSYIFEGKDGIGKFDLAITFAQALLCTNYNDEPCNSCASCIQTISGNNPDIHILSPKEKSIKREDIDRLIESISVKPYQSDKKVYIIKNSEYMTPQAANTFLKTLEEPVGNTVIILLTQSRELLLSTIQSRCQILSLMPLNDSIISEYIIQKYGISSEKANLIAAYSEGVIGKAVDIIDGKNTILEKRLDVFDIFDKIITLDKNILFQYENYFEENKDSIDEIIQIFMILFRDIIFKKNNLDSYITNKDFTQKLSQYSQSFNTKRIAELVVYLEGVLFDIDNNVNYKLIIDNMLLKLQEGVN